MIWAALAGAIVAAVLGSQVQQDLLRDLLKDLRRYVKRLVRDEARSARAMAILAEGEASLLAASRVASGVLHDLGRVHADYTAEQADYERFAPDLVAATQAMSMAVIRVRFELAHTLTEPEYEELEKRLSKGVEKTLKKTERLEKKQKAREAREAKRAAKKNGNAS